MSIKNQSNFLFLKYEATHFNMPYATGCDIRANEKRL